MLIQNYGLFWNRTHIHFGAGSNAGHLNGILAGAKTSKPIDFREQQGVYCLYDDTFRLVYVGQAGGKNNQRLFQRLKQHRDDDLSERWTKFSWFGIRRVLTGGKLQSEKQTAHPDTGEILNHIEAILIAAAEPVQNKQGGKFGDNVQRYIQHHDRENLGLDLTKMVRQIWDKINNSESSE